MTAVTQAPNTPAASGLTNFMAAQFTRNFRLAVVCLAISACATEQPHLTSRVTQTTPEEAARLLGCSSEEVAFCVETSCELADYQCASRGDVRELFKAGEFRH